MATDDPPRDGPLRDDAPPAFDTARAYRDILDATGDAIFVHDAETGQILDVNQTMLEMYGCTREEIGRLRPADLTAPVEGCSTEEAVRLLRLAADGHPQQFQWMAKTKAGKPFPVEVSLRRTMVAGRARVLATVRDISTQVAAEDRLRARERDFRNLIENVPGLVYRCEVEAPWQMLYMSEGAAEVTGRHPEAFISGDVPFADIILPEDLPRVTKAVTEGVAHREPYQIEYRIGLPEGGIRWVFDRGRATYGSSGKPVFLDGVILDITERRQAEEEQARFFAFSTALFMIAGTDGIIQRVNPAWEQVLGCPAREMEGRPILDFVHPDDLEATKKETASLADGITTHFFINRYRHRNGTWRMLSWTAHPIADKNLIYALAVDITEHRKTEERLRQSEKMGAIGQLAGGVAHDFNNQLTAIQGYADLLNERLDDPVLKRYAESILVASRRSADLTRQLLAFARKGQYQSLVVDVHNIVHEVVEILERSIDKRIRIRQHLDAHPATVLGDPSQLQNALLNLGLNARDAMPEGGDLVFGTDVRDLDAVYCRNAPYEVTPGKYLQLRVTDNGVGMPEDVQEHLFEPFFTTKEQGKGTGMGLAAVYGTVKNHRGFIEVSSRVKQGTTVEFFIPLHEATAPAVEKDAAPPAETSRPSARILIVDDETMICELAAEMLRAMGHQVTTCQDGMEAVAYYREHWKEIDLVILDMVMPGRSGRDTFLDMRRINPAVKALLSSGFSVDGDAQKILDEGVQGFLQKPYSIRELSQKLSTLLG